MQNKFILLVIVKQITVTINLPVQFYCAFVSLKRVLQKLIFFLFFSSSIIRNSEILFLSQTNYFRSKRKKMVMLQQLFLHLVQRKISKK